MGDIVLGDMCRKNFGLKQRYNDSLNPIYKEYIQQLEKEMIAVTYGNDFNKTTITKSFVLDLSPDQIEACLGDIKYYELETALISFCQLHNVSINIQRNNNQLDITVEMLLQFGVSYT